MKSLPQSHPLVHSEMTARGAWTVQRAEGVFNCVSADQAIEQSINRDCKTSGGIRGITLTRGSQILKSAFGLL